MRPKDIFKRNTDVLILDKATCHYSDGITSSFKRNNTHLQYIHPGLTKVMQFLDTHVNKPFKDQLKEKWATWMEDGLVEYTSNGNRRRASYALVADWVGVM